MSKHANPALIGAFVLGAAVLGVITVLLLAGSQWLQKPGQHVMYFDGTGQGLQEGAPVVFLGVKVGTVKRIHLGLNQEDKAFMVAVEVEVMPSMVQTHTREQVDLRDRSTIRRLVERGLRARLRMQSLLTGQLYIDLDFHPEKPARLIGLDPDQSEIPTIPTTVDELASKLEGFPLDKFIADIAVISESIKQIITAPEISGLPSRLEETLAHLESLTRKLDGMAPPLVEQIRADLDEMQKTLAAAHSAAAKIGDAADRLGAAADKTGTAAGEIGALARPDSPVVVNLANAGKELAATARTVQALTDSGSATVYDIRAALKETTRTAQALRELAETLDQQPEAIIRGKR